MRQIAGITATGGIRAKTVDGELLVAVLAVHFVSLLFISFFGFIAGITGIKGGFYATISLLDRKEGDLLAAIFEFIEMCLAVSQFTGRNGCHPAADFYFFIFAQ